MGLILCLADREELRTGLVGQHANLAALVLCIGAYELKHKVTFPFVIPVSDRNVLKIHVCMSWDG